MGRGSKCPKSSTCIETCNGKVRFGGRILDDLRNHDKKGNLYGTTENGGSGGYGTVYKFDPANGQKTILHNFYGGVSDGASPFDGALVFDKEGNIYGTTAGGGVVGGGTIYKLAPDGTFTILHSFTNQPDGDSPLGNVVFDKQGNLYTTTSAGGATTNGALIKVTP